jgi:FkbH-like protein
MQGPPCVIHMLSTFNVASIESALHFGLRTVPCRPELVIAPLDTLEQQIFDERSPLYERPGIATVVFWRAEELLADSFWPLSRSEIGQGQKRIDEVCQRIRDLAEAYLNRGSAPLFLSTLALPMACGSGITRLKVPGNLNHAISQINATVFELNTTDSRLRVFDLNWWAASEGFCHYDAQMDFLARQPFTLASAMSLGLFLARNLRPLLLPRRKVLVVDLDDTLWGGIVGEDGIQQLKLGRDFPGNVFLRLQREILELKNQGVLLVLVSKNNENEAREAMAQIPGMLLRWEDFACHKINFNHKYVNVREAADEIGLGLDSFALLDDSNYEREQMRAFNPEVLIINDRSDALHMLKSLLQSDAFDAHYISAEDRSRHREYELRAARTARPVEGGIEEFLSSLKLRAKVEPVGRDNIERVVQLLSKTNQFNVTTRRHQIDEVKRIISQSGSIHLTLRLTDRFGDQGIVGVLLAVAGSGDASLLVDSFLVSCRALSRGVEEVLWAELVNRAAAKGMQRIHGNYLPTAKNSLVANLYDRFGLKRTREANTGIHYVLEPVQPIAFPSWITVDKTAYERK